MTLQQETWIRAAFRQDVAPRGAKEATLAALGLGTATVSSIALAAAPAHAALTSPKVAAVLFIKWMGTGALAATIAVSAHHVATRAPAPPAAVPSSPVPERSTSTRAARAVRIAPLAATTEPPAAPVAVSARARPAPPATPQTSEVEPAGTVHDEVAAIQRARNVLLAGDSVAALDAIAAYDKAFSAGILSREARVLEIEAYAKKGDGARAVRLAKAYLLAHPADAHTRRLENIIDQEQEP